VLLPPPALAPAPQALWAAAAKRFAAHRSAAYARLARAGAADPFISDLGAPLLVLHALRWAALQGRAKDP
jgi:hypothetical protein